MTRKIDPLVVKTHLPIAQRQAFFWTLERYHTAIDKEIFTEVDNLELVYGKIVELMPAGTSHEECVNLLSEFFQERFGNKYRYREEKSISLPEQASGPEPDLVVVAKKRYGKVRPTADDIHLIVEVSKSSLKYDRQVKAHLYAGANLVEYWIVNLVNREIEVYLDPKPEQNTYGSIKHYGEAEKFMSPFAGEVVVAELLPDAEEE